MSEIMIALLLLVPIIVVVIILNTVHKNSKKRTQAKIHQYITEVLRETAMMGAHQQQLIHQTLIIDQKSRRLLIADHKEEPFTFAIFPFDLIKSVQVSKEQGSERIITRIGVELMPADTFITLYDYEKHNVFQIADFEKEANNLKETIDKARTKPSLVT